MSGIPEYDGGEATPVITHSRDLVVAGGMLEQDYQFLDYDFAPAPVAARAYLDEPGVVILSGALVDVPAPVLHYLQYRFERIEQQTPSGRTVLWAR